MSRRKKPGLFQRDSLLTKSLAVILSVSMVMSGTPWQAFADETGGQDSTAAQEVAEAAAPAPEPEPVAEPEPVEVVEAPAEETPVVEEESAVEETPVATEAKEPVAVVEEATTEEVAEPVAEDTTEDEEEAAEMPAQSFSATTASGVVVNASSGEGVFPEGTTLAVTDIAADQAIQVAQSATDGTVADAAGVDISFYNADGAEIEPADAQSVSVTISLPAGLDGGNAALAHQSDNGSVANVSTASSVTTDGAAFSASEFSPYVVYTVNFTYDGYTYTLDGEGEILLSTILSAVGIDVNVADVMSVDFTNPDVLSITKQGSDWLLTSLASFETDETLTVTLADGTVYKIDVTDPSYSSSTVDHIDIGITADASATIPYIEAGQLKTKTLRQTVNVTAADLRGATITSTGTFSRSGSYSTSTGSSGIVQVRIGGTYEVGTRSNPVYYTVTLTKTVTFTDASTGETYDIPVTLAATFTYWSSENDCPGIGRGDRDSSGVPTTVSRSAGMDFVLGGTGEDVRAVQVVKMVVDQSGKTIALKNATPYTITLNGPTTGDVSVTVGTSGTGIAQKYNLADGTYSVTESNPAETVTDTNGVVYTYDHTYIAAESGSDTFENANGLTSGGVVINANNILGEFIVYNVYKSKGSVTITKTGENGEALAGATFQLLSGTTIVDEATTNESGIATFSDVTFGTYTLHESSAPEGYTTVADQEVTVSSSNSEVTKNIQDNLIRGTVKVTKTDATTKAALPGATFTLSNGDAVIATAVTDANGIATFEDIPYGTYTLTETVAPAGYEITFEPTSVTINTQGQVVEKSAEDAQKLSTISVTKVDETTNTPLAGAEFQLLSGDKVIDTESTDANGVATFTGVAFGTYTIRESKAPTGYTAVGDQSVTINGENAGTTVSLTFKDAQKTGTITVKKVDAITNAPLKGAEFQLIAGDEVVAEAVDNNNGSYTFSNVAFGEYTVREVKAPQGYDAAKDQTVTVSAQNVDAIDALTFKDPQKTAKVTVTKYDEKDESTKLTGAEFQLLDGDGSVLYTATDKGDGTYTFEGVAFGTYELHESQTPEGYGAAEDLSIEVNASNVEAGVAVKVTDPQKTGTITVNKTDSTTKAPLAGATFKLVDKETGGSIESVTLTTGENGVVTFEGVPFGTYTLTEVSAPEGYAEANWSQEVTINASNVEKPAALTYNVTNDELATGKIVVTKTDATTGALLSGAEFTLSGKNSAGENVTSVVTTGADGTAIFSGLAFGTYTVTETAAPQGYELPANIASETITINAKNVSGEQSVTFADPQKTGTITVDKVDATTKAPLDGATFQLFDVEGKPVLDNDGSAVTATSGENGIAIFTDVAFGKYIVREIEAPQGYDAAGDQETTIDATTVEDGIKLTFEDVQHKGTIVVTKLDATTGEALSGAEFTLSGKNSAAEDVTITATSNKDGIVTFENVPFGTYTITETKAPEGYEVATSKTVSIGAANVDKGETRTFEDAQKTGTVAVSKVDATTGAVLSGAEFQLINPDGEVVQTATTGDDGMATFSEVAFGTYTVREAEAPEGYEVAEDQSVTIDAENVESGVSLTFEDVTTKTSVSVGKVWNDSSNKDGIRPDSVTVHLLADKVDTGKVVTLSADNNWSAKFEDLDAYKSGKRVEYTVSEDAVDGYAASYLTVPTGNDTVSVAITNTHEVKKATSAKPAAQAPTPKGPAAKKAAGRLPQTGDANTGTIALAIGIVGLAVIIPGIVLRRKRDEK